MYSFKKLTALALGVTALSVSLLASAEDLRITNTMDKKLFISIYYDDAPIFSPAKSASASGISSHSSYQAKPNSTVTISRKSLKDFCESRSECLITITNEDWYQIKEHPRNATLLIDVNNGFKSVYWADGIGVNVQAPFDIALTKVARN